MSNIFVKQEFPLLELGFAMRHQMLKLLSDEDLTYQFPNNLTLGGLCREMVEIEYSYIESFKMFKQDFAYRAPNAVELETNLTLLGNTFALQEQTLKATLAALSDEVIQNQVVDRGDFKPLIRTQFHIYREAVLIFFAKAMLYLRALQKPIPEQWQAWIG